MAVCGVGEECLVTTMPRRKAIAVAAERVGGRCRNITFRIWATRASIASEDLCRLTHRSSCAATPWNDDTFSLSHVILSFIFCLSYKTWLLSTPHIPPSHRLS